MPRNLPRRRWLRRDPDTRYVWNECRSDARGVTFRRELRIRRGNCAPVMIETIGPTDPSRADTAMQPDGTGSAAHHRARMHGRGRWSDDGRVFRATSATRAHRGRPLGQRSVTAGAHCIAAAHAWSSVAMEDGSFDSLRSRRLALLVAIAPDEEGSSSSPRPACGGGRAWLSGGEVGVVLKATDAVTREQRAGEAGHRRIPSARGCSRA